MCKITGTCQIYTPINIRILNILFYVTLFED